MKILVPVDGSKQSMEGVKVAADYAKTKKAKIYLINVVSFIPGMDLEISAHRMNDLVEEMKRAGEAVLEKASSQLKTDGITAETILSTAANAAEEIISVAEKEKVELVIIGSRGLTGAARFMLGSTASKVVRHCLCSVYVVKTVF
ncbi:MAG: universal stress protein [Thermodesulfovibrionales bacterium]|nr:universal stress protein [Thermodesulfovibrionales bacterium]